MPRSARPSPLPCYSPGRGLGRATRSVTARGVCLRPPGLGLPTHSVTARGVRLSLPSARLMLSVSTTGPRSRAAHSVTARGSTVRPVSSPVSLPARQVTTSRRHGYERPERTFRKPSTGPGGAHCFTSALQCTRVCSSFGTSADMPDFICFFLIGYTCLCQRHRRFRRACNPSLGPSIFSLSPHTHSTPLPSYLRLSPSLSPFLSRVGGPIRASAQPVRPPAGRRTARRPGLRGGRDAIAGNVTSAPGPAHEPYRGERAAYRCARECLRLRA